MTGVANAGWIRPPFVYLAAVGTGLLWPVKWLPAPANVAIGAAVTLAAATFFVSAVRTLRKAGTPVPGNRATTAIVRAGPYAFSRNPIYLAFTLFRVGIAAGINSAGVLLALVPAFALMELVVIPREERYLEARFPSEYPRYKREVRRWL